MSEADWSQMLDLHVVVAGFLWAFCCWENTPEWGREELPWCRCDHELPSTSIVSPPSLEDQVKTRSKKRKQRFGNFCTCMTYYGISKWENWVFLIFAKGRQIRGCLLGHMHKSGNSAAGGGKTFPLQTEVWAHLYLIPGWRRGNLETLLATMLNIISLGLSVWTHRSSPAHLIRNNLGRCCTKLLTPT